MLLLVLTILRIVIENIHQQYDKYFSDYNFKGMNFPVGYNDIEKFQDNNPNIVLKIYGVKGVLTHTTKKELDQKMFPFYFPVLTPEEIKAKKVLYLLILFPNDEVITFRLKKNNYDIGHIIPIVDIN